MGANPLQGLLEGVGPENQDFFGPEMATHVHKKIYFLSTNGTCFARCHLRAQKSLDFQGPSNGFASIKIITSRAR
jgi:hypothetical protein